MKPLNLFFIIIVTTLLACNSISDVEVDLPVQKQKLVLQSFISPQDTVIEVNVSLSQPIFNNPQANEFPTIENALVKISDGAVTKTLTFYSNTYNTRSYYGISTSEFSIDVGKTYYLTVTTPDGKSVSASTTIPTPNKTLSCSLVETTDEYSDLVIAQWNDPAGVDNYYQFWYAVRSDYDSTYSDYPISMDYSDKNNDGMLLTKRIEINAGYIDNGGKASLIHASKEYYLYHSKVNEAMYSGNDPFSERIQLFSNIEGGYGIFAGFNTYELLVNP